ncbi:MAG TPA: hypothetical protein VHW01_13960 [Polyangiaceae bacterium]|nr:hypothetical protein [Polyangiaceae bacterium]
MRIFIGISLLLCACGSSSSDGAGAGGADGSAGTSGGACPSLAGIWTIKTHCVSSFVGQTVTVTQSACSLSLAAPFDGYSGSVKSDGSLDVSGPTASGTQECTGAATPSSMSLSCPGPCAVTLGR